MDKHSSFFFKRRCSGANLEMKKTSLPYLPLLIAALFMVAVLSLGAAVYLLGQQTQTANASESLEVTPATIEAAVPQPTMTSTAAPSPTPQLLSVAIADGAQLQSFTSRSTTVGEVLVENGIVLETADTIDPPPSTRLEQDMVIQINRAIPLTIEVDQQVIHIITVNNEPLAALAEAGVQLGENDTVEPEPGSALQANDRLQVKRISEDVRYDDEEIPFQTVYQPSDQLDLDSKAVLSNGVPGILRRSYRLIYEDGVQVDEVFEGEWVEQEPANQVIGYGTRITTATVETPEGPREYWRVVRMRATAYTAASSGKAPDHPNYGITASGLSAGTGIVAVDPNVIPFRSEVFVPGYGVGFAGDTGGGVKGRWIDLGFDEDELETWNGYADVYYLTPIPEKINYLLPEVLP